ncbi:MAG: cytochrome c biogenesis protein CcdA [Candidatus Tectomicrobia bacterium]|uniref:Cytochrome c biogenesis protein CcdA n=1 Tax=Tectimicrobiota bacterium TaxID=2528274 RepID=A0A932GRB2_UNCTE|nr:cytochrome c biogenesis protein CcdA [Candidatus Tectomicrobia bacterium]
MDSVLLSSSLITSYLAGVVALFAPCCITFLLPAYWGSIFKERGKVLVLTAIFFIGILVVFLPVGLGAAVVGQWLGRFHTPVFYAGGTVLVFLGTLLLFGKSPSVHVNLPVLEGHDPITILLLGVFSGIASACCAPVFAGVATLSALAGTPLGGGVLTFAYVLGMVSPLFILSWFWDRFEVSKRMGMMRKTVTWGMGSFRVTVPAGYLLTALVFLAMGFYILWLTVTDQLVMTSSWGLAANLSLVRFLRGSGAWLVDVPQIVWVLLFAGLIGFVLWSLFRKPDRTREER